MSMLDDLNEQKPYFLREAKQEASSMLSLQQIQQRYADYESRMTALGLMDRVREKYDDILIGMKRVEFADPGLRSDYLYQEYDVNFYRAFHDWNQQKVSVNPQCEHGYDELLRYTGSLYEERRQFQDVFFMSNYMSNVLEEALEGGELTASQADEALALNTELQMFTQDRIQPENVAKTSLCLNAINKLMLFAWKTDGTAEPEHIFSDLREMNALAVDMTAKGFDYHAAEDALLAMPGLPAKVPDSFRLIVEAPDASFAEPFLNHTSIHEPMKEMKTGQRKFAEHNFDSAISNVFSADALEQMRGRDEDMFDHLFIDGMSLNSRYGSLYKDVPYFDAVSAMKCQAMSEILHGKQLTAAVPAGDSVKVIPIAAEYRIPYLPAPQPHPSQLTKAQEKTEIERSLAACAARSQDEKMRKHDRMLLNRPYLEELPPVMREPSEPDLLFSSSTYTKALKSAAVSDIFRLSGSMDLFASAAAAAASPDTDALTQRGSEVYNSVMSNLALADDDLKDSHLFSSLGYDSTESLLYVDGKPLKRYLKEDAHFEDARLSDPNLVHAAAAAIISGAEHHVDCVRIGMDEYGRYETSVTEVKPDLHFMDGQEGLFSRSRAHRAEKLYAEDPKIRQSAIEREVSEHLVRTITKELNAQHEPYAVQAARYKNSGSDVAGQYFTKETKAQLEKSVGSNAALTGADFAGTMRLAQVLLLRDNPNVRFADLMNPDAYRDRKETCGKFAADQLECFGREREYQAWEAGGKTGPEPPRPDFSSAAALMAAGMELTQTMDVRKELLYALGQPENLSDDEMRSVLDDPKMNLTANAFLCAVADFQSSCAETLRTMAPGERIDDFRNLSSAHPLYRELAAGAGSDSLSRYETSLSGFSEALKYEKAIQNHAAGTAELNPQEICMDRYLGNTVREQIISGKNPSALTADDLKNLNQAESRLAYMLDFADIELSKGEMNRALYKGEVPARLKATADSMRYGDLLTAYTNEADPVFGDYRNFDPSDFRLVTEYSKLGAFDRTGSRMSLAYGLAMADGKSLSDILNTPVDQMHEYGSSMMRFAMGHPIANMEDGPDKNAAVGEMAGYFDKWYQALAKEKFPSYDFSDVNQACANARHISALRNCAIDISQCEQDFRKIPEYQAHFDPEAQAKTVNAIGVCQVLSNAVQMRFNPKFHLFERAASAFVADELGPEIKGKTMEELGEIFDGDMLGAFHAFMNTQMQTVPESKLAEYLNGSGPCPIDRDLVINAIPFRKETPEPVKEAEKVQEEPAKEKPAPQKTEEPRKKVGLGLLESEEPKKEVHTARHPRPDGPAPKTIDEPGKRR